jgi:hypothetical protein
MCFVPPTLRRHYHSVNVMGNTLRRIGNTVTCFAAPLMYHLHPALPFVLFGSLTLLWTCALSVLFAQHARECTAEDVSCIAHRNPWSAANLAAAGVADCDGLPAASCLAGLEHYMQLSFVSQERRFWAQADGHNLLLKLQQPTATLQSHVLSDTLDDDKQHKRVDGACDHGFVQGEGKLLCRSRKVA